MDWPVHSNELSPRQSPGMLLRKVFPSNSSQKAPGVKLDLSTLTHDLVTHAGVHATPTCSSCHSELQTKSWIISEKKESKAPHLVMILSLEGHQQDPKEHLRRGGVGLLHKGHALGNVDVRQSVSHRHRDQMLYFVIFNSVDIAFAI